MNRKLFLSFGGQDRRTSLLRLIAAWWALFMLVGGFSFIILAPIFTRMVEATDREGYIRFLLQLVGLLMVASGLAFALIMLRRRRLENLDNFFRVNAADMESNQYSRQILLIVDIDDRQPPERVLKTLVPLIEQHPNQSVRLRPPKVTLTGIK